MKHIIAINGYGRIGRCVARALYESSHFHEKIQLAAINEIAESHTVLHLTKFDSTHGKFPEQVSLNGNTLCLGQDKVVLFQKTRIEDLPWSSLGIDAVLDCTGVFGGRTSGNAHIAAGAKKVIYSHPGKEEMDAVIVYGVNHDSLRKTDQIISNASCTSNCVVPILDVLDRELGIERGGITTIHSAMNDQPVIDSHHQDLRKTRSVLTSIIPVSTSLEKGIGRLLPRLKGKFETLTIRIPTPNVSLMDITLAVEKDTTAEQVNLALTRASQGRLSGILGVSDEQLVSCDFNHDSRSCVVDLVQTRVSARRLVKIQAWFDNEWGFANRMLDTTLAALTAR